jgi:nitroreductase
MRHPKHVSSGERLLEVIRERWSPRAFDPGRDVSIDDLQILFEAARWAPSSSNEQPWRFVLASRQRTPEAFSALLAALSASNQTWARQAPLLVLVASSRTRRASGALNESAVYDTGQAVAFLTLQATGLGLGVRQMEGFDRERARTAVAVPQDFEPLVVMAIGYRGDPDSLASERHRLAEREPRSRQPAAEFVFEGGWAQPVRW